MTTVTIGSMEKIKASDRSGRAVAATYGRLMLLAK
jgi:hypothetical protein